MAIEKDIAVHHTHGIENVITYTKNPEKATLSFERQTSDGHVEIDRLVLPEPESETGSGPEPGEDIIPKTSICFDDEALSL